MCKVKESKDCSRSLVFKDDNGYNIEIPLSSDRKDKYGEEEIENIIQAGGYDPATVTNTAVIMNKEKDTVYISSHAMMRLRKRLGFNRSAAFRMTKKAYEEGISNEKADGYLRTWIEGKLEHVLANNDAEYRIYGQYAFVFTHNVLVTVYNMVQKESYKVAHEKFRDKSYNRSKEKRMVREHVAAMAV